MNHESELNDIRGSVLKRIDRKELEFKVALLGAALIEFAGLMGFLLLADFSNRLHVLLLVTAMLVYCTLALGLVALGAHMGRCTLRVLKAIELLDSGSRGNRA